MSLLHPLLTLFLLITTLLATLTSAHPLHNLNLNTITKRQSSGNAGHPDADNGSGSAISGGAIAGIVVGCVVFLAIVGGAIVFAIRRAHAERRRGLVEGGSGSGQVEEVR